jgi:hypothetical protein
VHKEVSNADLKQIYSPKIAYLLYDQFAPLLGLNEEKKVTKL